MNFIELSQPFWVLTPIGWGVVLFVNDYGWNENMIWTVALNGTGEIRHFNTTQVRMHSNPTWEFDGPVYEESNQ